MTVQNNYSSEELAKVAGSVMMSAMAVSMVDLGIISTAIEATALAKELAGAAKKYPNNSIIQAIFSEETIKQNQATTKIEVKPEDMKPDRAIATAVTAIHEGISVLEGKATPEEIKEYKEFIYHSAEQVAKAAGSGLFGTGEKVSAKEAEALAKIKETLAV